MGHFQPLFLWIHFHLSFSDFSFMNISTFVVTVQQQGKFYPSFLSFVQIGEILLFCPQSLILFCHLHATIEHLQWVFDYCIFYFYTLVLFLKLLSLCWNFMYFSICLFSLSFFGCATWLAGILVPWPGIEPRPLVVRAGSPNHWTAREFPLCFVFAFFPSFFFFFGGGMRRITRGRMEETRRCLLRTSSWLNDTWSWITF